MLYRGVAIRLCVGEVVGGGEEEAGVGGGPSRPRVARRSEARGAGLGAWGRCLLKVG